MQYVYKLLAIWQAALLITIPSLSLQAAIPRQIQAQGQGQYPQQITQDSQSAAAIKEVRNSVESMKHAIRNQETEIRTFEEKLESLDSIIESIRDELSNTSMSHKEQLKGSTGAFESKLTSVETSIKGILADLKQFQAYTAESSAALLLYQKKITDLEKSVTLQNQNMDDMQAAIKSLTEVLQIKHSVPSKLSTNSSLSTATAEGVYTVKDGDSLDKIARAHQTTIKALKELNNLTTDRIVVGKQLKIPSS